MKKNKDIGFLLKFTFYILEQIVAIFLIFNFLKISLRTSNEDGKTRK